LSLVDPTTAARSTTHRKTTLTRWSPVPDLAAGLRQLLEQWTDGAIGLRDHARLASATQHPALLEGGTCCAGVGRAL
jgi:hypothetical protein